jgi:hypothetical protein
MSLPVLSTEKLTCKGQAQWLSRLLQLCRQNHAGMRHETSIQPFSLGEESNDISPAEAVADGANLLDTILVSQNFNRVCNDRVDNIGTVLGNPRRKAKALFESVRWHWIAVEEVGRYDEVAGGGHAVR